MSNRLTHLAILISFCLNIFGCTTRPTVQFFADEVAENVNVSVEKVQLCSKVSRITTWDGSQTVVDSCAVKSDSAGIFLSVRNVEGGNSRIPFYQIKNIRNEHNGIVIFSSASGTIDLNRQIITGLSVGHQPIVIPLADACQITGLSDKRKPDYVSTLGLTGAFIGLMVLGLRNMRWL